MLDLIFQEVLPAAVRSGTPLLFATLGEILTERSGVLNLGLEGIMLVGALSAFASAFAGAPPLLAAALAFAAGAFVSLPHALLSVKLKGNQVVSGVALAMLGSGISAALGKPLVGQTIRGFEPLPLWPLSELPAVGRALFRQDPMVYLSYLLVLLVWVFLHRSSWGLRLRACGESPRVADAMGVPVDRVRIFATCLGGGIVALGGAYLPLSYTRMWVENISAGRGWIAVALVIFSLWDPKRALWSSYLFGGLGVLQFYLQTRGVGVPTPFLLMIPYLATLVLMGFSGLREELAMRLSAPSALGKPYDREER